jgi:hypothetical protein
MDGMYQDIPADLRQKVVDLYRQGTRLRDITAETGMDRPTIYWILRTANVRPDRNKSGESVSAETLLERIEELQRAIGKQQAYIDMLEGRRQQSDR